MIVGPHGFGFITGFAGTTTSSYEDVILGDNPAAYWRLDETSGTTATDKTGNGRDGTYQGTYTLGESGLVNNGTSVLIGSDGNINFGSSWDFFTDAITVEQWVKWNGAQNNDPRLISRNVDGFRFRWIGRDTLEWSIDTVGQINHAYQFPDGDVVHVVGTYDGSNMRLYINGSEVASISATGDLPGNGDVLYFNNESSGFSHPSWEGHVDEIAIYDRALTSTEIQEHYNAGVGN